MPPVEILLYTLRNVLLHTVLLKRLIQPIHTHSISQITKIHIRKSSRRMCACMCVRERECERKRKRRGADGDGGVDGLLLYLRKHVGALDDDALSGWRGGGRRRRGLPVVGDRRLHRETSRDAPLRVVAHFHFLSSASLSGSVFIDIKGA
jgi:hypothetical protein